MCDGHDDDLVLVELEEHDIGESMDDRTSPRGRPYGEPQWRFAEVVNDLIDGSDEINTQTWLA